MRYRIDAWLEKCEPEVRVLDGTSGAVLLNWGAKQLQWFIDNGYLSYEDFMDTQEVADNRLANTLLRMESNFHKHFHRPHISWGVPMTAS